MTKSLLERIREGDEVAFKELFYQHYQSLRNFAQSYLRDSYASENIAQEAFIILWEKRSDLDSESNLKAFLVTIVRNKSLNFLEKTRNRLRLDKQFQELTEREINTDIYTLQSLDPEQLYSKEIDLILQKAIEELPEQTRNVFLLSRNTSLSNIGIGQKLGITDKGVEYHITKALKHLRLHLTDYLPVILLSYLLK